MIINQLFAVALSFALSIVCKNQVEVIGQGFGCYGLLSWIIPTLIILLCVWKISSEKWNLGDLIASFVLIILILMYFYQDVSQIFLECSRIMLGACVGAIVAYSAKK